MNMCIAAQ